MDKWTISWFHKPELSLTRVQRPLPSWSENTMTNKYAKSFQSNSIIKSNALLKVLFIHQTKQSKCSTLLPAPILSLALWSAILSNQCPPHTHLAPNSITYSSCVHPFLLKSCHDLWPAWTQLWHTHITFHLGYIIHTFFYSFIPPPIHITFTVLNNNLFHTVLGNWGNWI